MGGLDSIAVKVVGGDFADDLPDVEQDNALPLLYELEALLEALAMREEDGVVDLLHLPLSPEDREKLRSALGDGDVAATVDALGATRIRETAIPGLWWVTHHNAADEVVGEFIEVTQCPELLRTPRDEARRGLKLLRARLETLSGK